MNNTLKSIGAVLAGLALIVVLSIATDTVLEKTGVFPSMEEQQQHSMKDSLLAIAFIYRVIISVAGCYLTSRLAPNRPMRHALILGFVGVIISLAGTIVMWSLGSHWYPIALVVVSLPCAWVGGKLRGRRD